eukprot:gene13300-20418_t
MVRICSATQPLGSVSSDFSLYTKRHFICLWLNFVNVEFVFRSHCLAFALWEGPAENFPIAEWKKAQLKRVDLITWYGLEEKETRTNTTDAGSNFVAACEREEAEWLRCGSHNIGNGVDFALGRRKHKVGGAEVSTNPEADAFCARLRGLLHADHFIRWNGTHRMAERELQLREAVEQYYTKYDPHAAVRLTAAEWTATANLIGSLQGKTVMLSDAYGVTRSLIKACNKKSPVLVPSLVAGGGHAPVAHKDLDPVTRSVRERLSDDAALRNRANRLLDEEWKERTGEEVAVAEDPDEPSPKKAKKGHPNYLDNFNFFDDIEEKAAAKKEKQKETELSMFRDLPPLTGVKNFNLLQWWKERQERFPRLSALARSAFGARPTSANAERGFSHARNLVDPLRASMSGETIEMWMLNKLGRLA